MATSPAATATAGLAAHEMANDFAAGASCAWPSSDVGSVDDVMLTNVGSANEPGFWNDMRT
jgi:hypothetical protein